MCDDTHLLALHAILTEICSDKYEYGQKQTVGGATGIYKLRSPWNTECEYTIFSATGSNPGSFIISNNPGANTPASNGSASYGLASSGGESNYIPGTFMNIPTNGSFEPSILWEPLPSPGDLFFNVTASANQSVFITIGWRRKLARFIPDMPRPATPHRPLALDPHRRTFMGGTWARYIEDDTPYHHENPEQSNTDRYPHEPFYGQRATNLAPKPELQGSPKAGRRAYREGQQKITSQLTGKRNG